MLTDAERKAIRLAGELYTHIQDYVCGDGSTRDDDLAELRASIHHVQHLVMAQAAARLYPGELRPMGGTGGYAGDMPRPPAVKLLEEALHLRMNGEYAPGGTNNWHDWDNQAEVFLRSLLPPEAEGPPTCTRSASSARSPGASPITRAAATATAARATERRA